MMDANEKIATALYAKLRTIDSFHFGSEGILLFSGGEQVGAINWSEGNRAAFDALTDEQSAEPESTPAIPPV